MLKAISQVQKKIKVGTHGEDYGSWMSNPVFYVFGGGTLLAAVLGSVIYRAICALVLQIGLDANYMKLFTALFITAAISVPALKKARGK